MIVDPFSSLQAVFAVVLLHQGRVEAERWFTRQRVERGTLALDTEQAVYGALWSAGVGCEVLGVVDSELRRVYSRVRHDSMLTLGVFKHGTGPDDSVWGMMWVKPWGDDGLAIFYPGMNRPLPTRPERHVYFDCAVRVIHPIRVRWELLVDLPMMG